MSFSKQRERRLGSLLLLLSHDHWNTGLPPNQIAGKAWKRGLYDSHPAEPPIVLWKILQKKHIWFGLTENWDQPRPLESSASHVLLLLDPAAFLSALPSLAFSCFAETGNYPTAQHNRLEQWWLVSIPPPAAAGVVWLKHGIDLVLTPTIVCLTCPGL